MLHISGYAVSRPDSLSKLADAPTCRAEGELLTAPAARTQMFECFSYGRLLKHGNKRYTVNLLLYAQYKFHAFGTLPFERKNSTVIKH